MNKTLKEVIEKNYDPDEDYNGALGHKHADIILEYVEKEFGRIFSRANRHRVYHQKSRIFLKSNLRTLEKLGMEIEIDSRDNFKNVGDVDLLNEYMRLYNIYQSNQQSS